MVTIATWAPVTSEKIRFPIRDFTVGM